MLPQIAQMPRPTAEQLQQGVLLMLRGFAKKLLLADVLGQYLVDPAIEDTAALSAPLLLLGLYGFTLQLYFDLSGYTDLARGAGKLLGIELMRNFNRPYHAASVSEFWQRWHISMSSFFRDYLYFAVGGSKHGNVYLNLLITFVAIGVWHGAGWNFVVYGALHGSLVAWERFWRTRKGRSFNGVSNRLLGIALTFHFVVFSRVLFVEHSLADALDFLDRLSSFSNWTLRGSVGFPPIVPAALVISLFLAFMPADISRRLKAAYTCLPALVQAGLIVLLAYVCMAVSVDQAAFVYFRF
jgi:D-alanyl-lipoteichoic acid acyltransferase DltB (MBOAT superfamily)